MHANLVKNKSTSATNDTILASRQIQTYHCGIWVKSLPIKYNLF